MKMLRLTLLALASLSLAACGSSSSTGGSSAGTSEATSEATSEVTSTTNKSFNLSETFKFVEAKTFDLKTVITYGEDTSLEDLEFSAISDNVTFANGVATATSYGFHNIQINIKGDEANKKDFGLIMGPLNFMKATYKGLTPSGRDDNLNYTYEGGAEITMTFNDTTFEFETTAGKGLKSGEQVDIEAAKFSGTITVNSGLIFLTNNEAGYSELKGNFMDSAEKGFIFKVGGFPSKAASANLTMVTNE